MNKPKRQGTAWETALVRKAQDAGLMADRMPEGGMNDAGDVWIGDVPSREIVALDIPVVAWSRLVKNGDSRRIPSGARSVIVMDTADFLMIATQATSAGYAFVVECKATQTLNVTRALANAKRKLTNWKSR